MELRLLDDQPEREAGRLGPHFERLTVELAKVIASLPPSSPVLISGDWGSGKTTLLHAIRNKLEARTDGRRETPTILFEAWHYENELPLLAALMRAVLQAVPRSYRDDEETRETRSSLWRSAVAACAGMGAGLAQVAVGPVGRAVMEGLVAAWRTDSAHDAKARIVPEEDATQQLWQSFKQLVDRAWPHQGPVILIDDLDRCSPTGAVALLDSIRLLVARADNIDIRCHFVVALDRTVMAQAIARKFSDISHYEGNRYLEKIFPISFALPRFDKAGLSAFIEQLVHKVAEEGPERDGELSEILCMGLASPIFANPRLIKRCINRYRILSHFELDNGRSEEQRRSDVVVVHWLAATERWPKLRPLLVRRSPEFWQAVKIGLASPDGKMPDAEISEFLKEQDLQLWVERELLAKDEQLAAFQQADERLRRFGL
jgi:hypothetical protein